MLVEYFGESVHEQCNNCDLCLYPRKTVSRDVTEHAALVVNILQSVSDSDQKITLLQCIDELKSVLKGKGKKSSVSVDEIPKEEKLKGDECERLLIQMLMDGYIREVHEHTPYSTVSYVRTTTRALGFRMKKTKLVMDFVTNEKEIKNARKRKNLDHRDDPQKMLRIQLSRLRSELAKERHVDIPSFVFTDEHINRIVESNPKTREEVEDIVGKVRAEKYADDILALLSKWNNSDSKSNEKSRELKRSKSLDHSSTISTITTSPSKSISTTSPSKSTSSTVSTTFTASTASSTLTGSKMSVNGEVHLTPNKNSTQSAAVLSASIEISDEEDDFQDPDDDDDILNSPLYPEQNTGYKRLKRSSTVL